MGNEQLPVRFVVDGTPLRLGLSRIHVLLIIPPLNHIHEVIGD
jgi:hypothetical protein